MGSEITLLPYDLELGVKEYTCTLLLINPIYPWGGGCQFEKTQKLFELGRLNFLTRLTNTSP